MAAGESLHAVQIVVLLLMIMVSAFAVMARRIKIPYPIVLVVAGLLISFVPHVPRIPLNSEIVFLIFLPPLLYAAAWQTSWREFQHNLVTISLLAFGLVGFTVWGIAEVADRFITSLDWKSGLVLGAVVATTDAIAAASIAKTIGLPQTIVDILEGESLINDATGLLALEFGLQIMVRGESPTVTDGLLRLVWLVVGGISFGLLIGVVVTWLEQWVDDGPIEMVISLIVPYAAYLAGESVRASGVLSVVACGLYLSRKSVTFFSPETRIQVMSAWSSLNFMLNGIVFALIGLQLPYVLAGIRGYSPRTLLEYGAVFSMVLIVLRLIWVFPASEVAFWIRTRLLGQHGPKISRRAVFVVGWTGMRGVIALAAAISLPEVLSSGQPFAQRNLIVFLAFCVIVVTLVLQGLTLPPLIRRLGLASETGPAEEETAARRLVLEKAIAHLEQQQSKDGHQFAHTYEDLLHRYRHRLAAVVEEDQAMGQGMAAEAYRHLRSIARDTIHVERQTLIHLRDQGKIGDEIMRRLERELDLTETRQKVDLTD